MGSCSRWDGVWAVYPPVLELKYLTERMSSDEWTLQVFKCNKKYWIQFMKAEGRSVVCLVCIWNTWTYGIRTYCSLQPGFGWYTGEKIYIAVVGAKLCGLQGVGVFKTGRQLPRCSLWPHTQHFWYRFWIHVFCIWIFVHKHLHSTNAPLIGQNKIYSVPFFLLRAILLQLFWAHAFLK